MADVKIVSSRTIIKKITVGAPVPHPTIVKIQTSVNKLLDVSTNQLVTGSVLVYDTVEEKWNASTLLNNQTMDGEEGF